MRTAEGVPVTLRVAAAAALIVGAVLVLGSWDGLYDALDLPQGLPALTAQVGGAALVGLAYLLWTSATRPELAPAAAVTGLIALGGGALVIAAWLVFRDQVDLRIGDLGTALLIGTAIVLGVVALGLARVALSARGEPAERSPRA